MQKKSANSRNKTIFKQEIENALIDNFVKLQKVMTNLSIRFDSLSDNITKLLQLFEIAAKSFVQKQEEKGGEADLLVKLDTLLDQNKTIAKGLTLIEEKIRHKLEPPESFSDLPSVKPSHTESEYHGIYREHSGLGGKPGSGQKTFQRF